MLIDLTHTITPEVPVLPGDPPVVFSHAATLTGDGFRTTALSFSSHTGTHMDAPSHLLLTGSSLDQMPISQFSGRATVLDVSELGPVITEEFLQSRHDDILCADFILLYTGWESRWGTEGYLEDAFPVPDENAAKFLASCGLKGLGTDAASVDRLTGPLSVHTALMKSGAVILEALCLKKVRGRKDFLFFAPPMKFQNADGAPVRAFADLRENFEKERRKR